MLCVSSYHLGAANGEFETCPVWVPGLDTSTRLAPINLKTILAQGFDHSDNWPQKFETYPTWGVKFFKHLHVPDPTKTAPSSRLWGVLWGCYFTIERKALLVGNHLRLDLEGDRWLCGRGQQNSAIGTFRLRRIGI